MRPWISPSIRGRAARAFAILSVASRSTPSSPSVRAYLSPAAARRRRQFVSRIAGDHAERTDRAAAQLLLEGVAAGLGALLRRRNLRRVKRNFFNSVYMTIPATILSTLFGAHNGYVLSKWRFPGSETLFVCIVLGVFMPGQIALLPWAYILGALRLSNSVYGLILVHVIQGLSFTTCSAATITSTFPTTSSRLPASTAPVSGASSSRSSCPCRLRSSSSP